MANKIKGLTLEIGGDTTSLSKALGGVNKQSKDLQSELRQVDRLLKLDPSNTTLLAQKQKILAEAVENSRNKLDTLKEAQKQVQQQFDRGEIGEDQYRAFQREVVKAEQELSKFEKQLKDTGITADQVAKKLGDAGKKMTSMGKTVSMAVTAPIVAAGAAAFKMAADFEDAMGATDQIFKNASDSVKKWADDLETYYGISETEALEYANMMGSMLVNIGGLTEEQAAKQAQTLIELAGDLTAMYGGTTADAVRALTGALKGNNTMLDNYGMAANDAMIKTKALEMGIYDGTGQMDLATKQAATLALIMEQTGAAQGQAAREADGSSGAWRTFTTEMKNLTKTIGDELLPVVTPFIARLNEVAKGLSELSPETQKTIVIVAGLAAAIGPLLIVLGAMASGLGAIVGILPVLGTALTVLTGPIGIVVAAIAGLIAIGVLLYKNWDEIAAFGIKMWDDLKAKFQDSINAIKDLWQGFKDSLTDTWKGLWGGVQNVFDGIKTVLTNATTKLTDDMLVHWEKFKGGIINIWAAIAGGVKGYINNMIGFVNKLIDALNSIKVEIPDWVPGFGGQKFGIDLPHVPALATGTNYIPRDMLAYLHKGEAVVPAKYNPSNTTTTVIKEIHIHGNNADEIWSKFERNLHKLGVVF